MTDTNPPTDLGDVVVVGQRRSEPHQPFPERPQPVVWDGEYDELPPDLGEAPDPCADPATALEWNADAAAAEAKRQFESAAVGLGDDGLYEREFGAQIYQRPDGIVYLGRVTYGDPMTGTFAFDESAATHDNLIGEIHSHPAGNTVPSAADWARMDGWSGWTGRNFRSYIVARDVSDPQSSFAIRVYDMTSDRTIDENGPDPEATPCP